MTTRKILITYTAHIVFLLESAGLEYITKNIAKNTEQKKEAKNEEREIS